jgi:hypothetical protein
MLLFLVNLVEFLYVCPYVCHVCFDLMRSFLLHLFAVLFSSLCLYFSLSLSFSVFPSVGNVVARSSLLFVLLSLVCRRTVSIVIREICKFDDRLGRADSVQTYYRLTVCMAEISERRRPSSVFFRVISERRRWIVAFIIEMCFVYTFILPCCCLCCRHFFLIPFLTL